MKELVIISGKGGTGKTSVVSSLSYLSKNSVLCDCDVDAADLHIILKPEIKKTHIFSGGKMARVDTGKCVNCGKCFEVCKFDAVVKKENHYEVDPVFCEGCGVCAWFCPEKAIAFEPEDNGEWYESTTRNGPLIHAKLYPAQENSGKLVSVIREAAKKTAETQNKDLIIIDGSPGVSCPVIASITGATDVLIVTEPSLSGKHDMERVIELCRHFEIPCYVAINKWDINESISNDIESFCREQDAPLLGKIRYDINITHAQVERKSIVEYTHEGAAADIETLWKKLELRLKGDS